jgi:hypothetical protein
MRRHRLDFDADELLIAERQRLIAERAAAPDASDSGGAGA